MVSSIGPFWDANETWLVLGVGILLVAFPRAHGVILSSLYLPVAAMLLGLIVRGVGFELRFKATGWHRDLWNHLFSAGSLVAALSPKASCWAALSLASRRAGCFRCSGLLVGLRPRGSLCTARRNLARDQDRRRSGGTRVALEQVGGIVRRRAASP